MTMTSRWLAILSLIFLPLFACSEPTRPVTLTFSIVHNDESRGKAPADLQKAIRKALEARLERRTGDTGKITFPDDSTVVVDFRASEGSSLESWTSYLGEMGRLEMKAGTSPEETMAFENSGTIPYDCETLPWPDATSHDPVVEKKLLVKKKRVTGNGDFKEARIQPDPLGSREGPGHSWLILFELKEEASKRFDAVTPVLHEYSEFDPGRYSGRMAMVRDGIIFSAPVIQSPKFGGQGQITGGFSKHEAEEYSDLIMCPPLPCRLERK